MGGTVLAVWALTRHAESAAGRLSWLAFALIAAVAGARATVRVYHSSVRVGASRVLVSNLLRTVSVLRDQIVDVWVVTHGGYVLVLRLASGGHLRIEAMRYPTRRAAVAAANDLRAALGLTAM